MSLGKSRQITGTGLHWALKDSRGVGRYLRRLLLVLPRADRRRFRSRSLPVSGAPLPGKRQALERTLFSSVVTTAGAPMGSNPRNS